MNILISGIYGRLGYNLAHYFTRIGHEVYGTHYQSLPEKSEFPSFFVNFNQTVGIIPSLQGFGKIPDFIIHTAAMTAVDQAQAKPEQALRINSAATREVCTYADGLHIPLVYISTDFVFDGRQGNYYEEDLTNPISVYGSSKLAGEEHVQRLQKYYILRMTPLAHAFRLPHHGRSIVEWLVEAADKNETVGLFDDKICSPVTSLMVADVINQAVSGVLDYGIYHLGYQDSLSLFAIGEKLGQFLGLSVQIQPTQHPNNAYGNIRPRLCNLKSHKIAEYSWQQICDSVAQCRLKFFTP